MGVRLYTYRYTVNTRMTSALRWARDFSPRVNFQCRLSYGVSATIRVQSLAPASAHVKHIKHLQALFGHTKILDTLVGMGGAAPEAAVALPR